MEQSAELDRLRRRARRDEDRVKTLVNQADSLRNRLEEADKRIAEGRSELDKLRSQHDSLRSLTAVRAERIRELEQSYGEQERRVHELEQQLRERDEAYEAALEELRKEHARAIAALETKHAETRAKEVPPAPPRPDDLRAIYGIGPKFERLLHEAGITSYTQIAAWTDDDIESIADQINTRASRIRKAGWVESAKTLLTERGEQTASSDDADGDLGAGEKRDPDLAW
jgi:predicted flap endonuclease-1-like 5' DNA nuclease